MLQVNGGQKWQLGVESNAGDFHLLLFLLLFLAEHAGEVLDARALFLGVTGDTAEAWVRLHGVNEVVHGAPSLSSGFCLLATKFSVAYGI